MSPNFIGVVASVGERPRKKAAIQCVYTPSFLHILSHKMGIVLGVEAVVGIVEAVEAVSAAAEAGEAIATGAEAGEVIASGTEAGVEAGTEAGTEAGAAVAEGGDALTTALENLASALQKVAKMVGEYIVIDQVFKAAKAILDAITTDPAAHVRAERMGILVSVLNQSITIIKNVNDWMQAHAKDTTVLAGIEIPVDQGVLAKFLAPLGSVSQLLYLHAA